MRSHFVIPRYKTLVYVCMTISIKQIFPRKWREQRLALELRWERGLLRFVLRDGYL